MSLIFDAKEDLHLQMIDLQQKLKKSEEERQKLEKTCNALIRAFKEDERMHYKALNNQYENFLEDCRLRKKRNDIILKSLCRIENRAKSLFNKTEKLKLLKDRYSTYLKQNDFLKKEEIQNEIGTKFKTSIKGQPFKSVHWKTPNLEDVFDQNLKDEQHLNEYSETETNLEITEKDVIQKIFTNSSIIEDQNNDFYKFFAKNQNKDISEDNLNHERVIFFEEGNQNDHISKNSGIYYKDIENISNEIKSEEKISESCKITKNTETILPLKIKGRDENIEKTSVKDIFLHSKEKMNDGPFIENNTFKNNILLNSSIHKDIPNNFEKTFKDISDMSIVEMKMSDSRPLSTESNQENIENLEAKSMTSKDVKHQESFSLQKNDSKNYNSEINNLKELTEDLKNTKSLPEKIIKNIDETNYEKIFDEKTCLISPNSDMVLVKEDNTFPYKTEEKNSEKLQSDENSDLFSDNKIYPKGMDGIDYENETYPDSYYEQPEHSHNISSIASNVILEEDEYDLEGNYEKIVNSDASQNLPTNNLIKNNVQLSVSDGKKDYAPPSFSLSTFFNQENACIIKNEPVQFLESKCSELEKNNKHPENSIKAFQNLNDCLEDSRNTDVDSEKSFKEEKETIFNLPTTEFQSTKETNIFEDKEGCHAEENKSFARSNLFNLLESDSESFQIEHGEPISANEDSDFDFSFKL